MKIEISKENWDALNESIIIWATRARGVEFKRDCPLCRLDTEGDCSACPIALFTGKTGCHGTPYFDWEDGLDDTFYAKKELRFLKKVREACVVKKSS